MKLSNFLIPVEGLPCLKFVASRKLFAVFSFQSKGCLAYSPPSKTVAFSKLFKGRFLGEVPQEKSQEQSLRTSLETWREGGVAAATLKGGCHRGSLKNLLELLLGVLEPL